ncbi:hypothetical protein Ancab_014485 [Ancistrocladus abbreviatus]
MDVTVDGNVFRILVIEEGPIADAITDPLHVLPRCNGGSRFNLSPDPSATDDSSEVRRHCSSGDPGVLPQRSAPAALGGRPTEHEDNVGRNMESGGQLASNTHACVHASLGDRGTSVERTVVPKENAVMNLESWEQLSAHSLEFCSHVNPLDLDPRNTEVHAVVRRLERGSSTSGTMRVLSTVEEARGRRSYKEVVASQTNEADGKLTPVTKECNREPSETIFSRGPDRLRATGKNPQEDDYANTTSKPCCGCCGIQCSRVGNMANGSITSLESSPSSGKGADSKVPVSNDDRPSKKPFLGHCHLQETAGRDSGLSRT